jgi:hypothetical protein
MKGGDLSRDKTRGWFDSCCGLYACPFRILKVLVAGSTGGLPGRDWCSSRRQERPRIFCAREEQFPDKTTSNRSVNQVAQARTLVRRTRKVSLGNSPLCGTELNPDWLTNGTTIIHQYGGVLIRPHWGFFSLLSANFPLKPLG